MLSPSAIVGAALALVVLSGVGSAGNGRIWSSRPPLDPLCLSACPGDRGPVWSADGTRIAFLDLGGPSVSSRLAGIGVIGADGRNERVLAYDVSSNGIAQALLWAPDGELLAFTTGLDVHVIRTDGGGLVGRSLTGPAPAPVVDSSPAWSPVGGRIAFVRQGSGPSPRFGPGDPWCCELRLMDPAGGKQLSLGGARGSGVWLAAPAYAPDGRLAYLRGETDANRAALPATAALYVANGDGGSSYAVAAGGGLLHGPLQWSADGTRVAVRVTSAKSELVRIVEVAGGQPVAFAASTGASLSPEFDRIAFTRRGSDGTPRLIVQRLTGGTGARVVGLGTPPEARALLQFSWAPDGRRLAYVTDGECPTVLAVHTVNADGSGQRRLDHGCRISGTARADRLIGTPRPDGLYGLGGNDRIFGRAGPDFVQGGGGNDRIFGEAGNDRLDGGPGHDRIDGGPGRDRIDARDHSPDRVVCGTGEDSVTADAADTVAPDCEHVTRG